MNSILVNGEIATRIDLLDRGFQYGDGVFTTILLREGVPQFLDQHLERLRRDCGRLGIPPVESILLRRDIKSVIGDERQGVIKIQITRGLGGRGYRPPEIVSPTRVVALHPLPGFPDQYPSEGIEVRYCRTRLGINPALAGIKHMNRLEQVLARSEWTNGRIAEGLMLDHEGQLVEGTMSNVFLVKDGQLRTPLLDRCGVAGVMRLVLIGAAEMLGIPFIECRLTPEDLNLVDEAFITNSVVGLWPISCLEGKILPIGPVTCELREWLTKSITNQINAS
ncbi:MAG: hypothetical protein RLZZ09_1432 [Pseudomonadota bacterium]